VSVRSRRLLGRGEGQDFFENRQKQPRNLGIASEKKGRSSRRLSCGRREAGGFFWPTVLRARKEGIREGIYPASRIALASRGGKELVVIILLGI